MHMYVMTIAILCVIVVDSEKKQCSVQMNSKMSNLIAWASHNFCCCCHNTIRTNPHYIIQVIWMYLENIFVSYFQRGLVHIKETEYFIEPVHGHDVDKDPRHPHLIYRRSALPLGLDIAHSLDRRAAKEGSCGVSGKSISLFLGFQYPNHYHKWRWA